MHLLFAEDDRQLRASVARGLREAGYSVDLADNGEEALHMARSGLYDAILLDVLLPAPDGMTVCRTLRDEGNRAPILMLTALDAVEHRIRGLDAGADDYLAKPFDFGELLARLRALTRRHLDPVSPELRIGDLVIDVSRRRVHRNRREIELTSTEFTFLLYLARNAGRVVSRADLHAQVWDDTRPTYSNIVDVYVSRLRRKIDDAEDVTLFRTMRGAGYMLELPEEPQRRRTAPKHTRRQG